jgi:hypothetical protein
MTLLVFEKTLSYEKACNELLAENGVRFAGVINNKGRLEAGGFKASVQPYENDEGRRVMYMELVLDLSMRKEFNSTLGKIRAVTSQHEKANLTSIPLAENLLLISTEPHADTEKLVSKSLEIFSNYCTKEGIID